MWCLRSKDSDFIGKYLVNGLWKINIVLESKLIEKYCRELQIDLNNAKLHAYDKIYSKHAVIIIIKIGFNESIKLISE